MKNTTNYKTGWYFYNRKGWLALYQRRVLLKNEEMDFLYIDCHSHTIHNTVVVKKYLFGRGFFMNDGLCLDDKIFTEGFISPVNSAMNFLLRKYL